MLKIKLKNLINKTNIYVTDEQIEQLIYYVEMLLKWNKAYNLTAIRNPEEILIKHIMDSLVVSPYLHGNTFIDVGTGAGLPGIPLAIINPNKNFDLVDSLGKRVIFLKQVKFELKLKNINPKQNRIELYKEKKFDGVISRAFASLNDMLNWCSHLINENGLFYALKALENEFPPEGFKIKETIKLSVPELNGYRQLIIIKKSKK